MKWKAFREDDGVRGPYAHLVPRIHLNNTHISVNNPENDPKMGRTDSPQINVQKRPHHSGYKGQGYSRNQVLSMGGRDGTWKMNPHNVWLWKPEGLNSASSYNQWGLTSEDVGSGKTRRKTGNWALCLKKTAQEIAPLTYSIEGAVWKIPGVHRREICLLISEHVLMGQNL